MRHRGFSLVELLVALAVFAAMAAAAYGGLGQLARTRAALAAQQDRFAALTRAVSMLERDLRQAVARPVRGNDGNGVPALAGSTEAIELTRLGFANPLAEPRSNLERVVYSVDNGVLRRGRYAALDRAPNSVPAASTLLERVGHWQLRYFGCDGRWRAGWPPGGAAGCELPRAVEFRFTPEELGEIRRVVELPSSLPSSVPGSPTGPAP